MKTQSLLQTRLESCLESIPGGVRRIVLAYSGGLDSSVLLHQLIPVSDRFEVLAWHVNHGLQETASEMESFCRSQAKKYHLKFKSSRLKLDPGSSNLESNARRERYKIFEDQLTGKDCLLTAHHADDQVETFILNVLRGSGSAGLRGIASSRPLGRSLLLRPLLGVSKQDLLAYAEAHDLKWFDDPSNKSDRFNRNYLRNQVTPLLRARWPGYLDSIQAVVSIQAETQDALDEFAIQDLRQLRNNSQGDCLPIPALLMLSPIRQKNLIRYWLRQANCDGLPRARLNQLIGQLNVRQDAMPMISGSGYDFRIYDQGLYLVPRNQLIELQECYDFAAKPLLEIESTGLKVKRGSILRRLRRNDCGQSIKLRFRQRDSGSNPDRHRLKRLFQKHKIPPWERPSTPQIYLDDELVGLWVQD